MIPAAATNYNGLQTEITLQTRSLTLNANYTYSKGLGNARDILDNTVGGYHVPWVAGVGIGADYSLWDTEVRNIFHASGTWALPFGHGRALLTDGPASWIACGWSLQGIAAVKEGQPFTIGYTTTNSSGLGCNALKVQGQNPYVGPHNATQFLNPAAFADPATGVTGFAALGGSPTQVTGPAYRTLGLSAFRQIPLVERTRLELRAEAFNNTNTPNVFRPRQPHLDYALEFRPNHQQAR